LSALQKLSFFAGLFFLFAPASFAAAQPAAKIIGIWATAPTEKGIAHIELKSVDGELVGSIIWLEEPLFDEEDGADLVGKTKTDRNNPKEKLRQVPIIGLRVLKGMKAAGKGAWEGGTIYDPENGKTYKSKISQVEPDVLKMRGYIGISLLGRTTEWIRVKK